MYRHLLVPVENTVLSTTNADAAVHLAQRLGARITFMHATADLAATRAGAALKRSDPATFAESTFGDSHTWLSRCAAYADAANVPCDTVSIASDHPVESIVETAKRCGCDLIVMATKGSQGLSGWLHGSNTERVLRNCPVALLVTRIATSDPITQQEQALVVIHEEHESIASVVLAMRSLVRKAQYSGGPLDISIVEAMLEFLQSYPRNHQQSIGLIHKVLRVRAPRSTQLLDELEARHQQQQALTTVTMDCVRRVMSDLGGDSKELMGHVMELADLTWRGLEREEQEIWPMAREHLTEEDWASISMDLSLAGRQDGDDELSVSAVRRLFLRIAELRTGLQQDTP